jgi:hypothetical protein
VQGPARDIHHPAGKRSQTETLCTAAPDWLVTRIANEAIDPDWTSPGLARCVILSGAARIRTTAVEWWSPVAGSGPEAVTAAVSVTTPGCRASTRAITVTVAPEAMSPKEHRSDGSSVQLPWLGFSDRMGFFPLDASVLTTWTAASGPRLVTVDRDGVGEHVAHGRHLRRNGLGVTSSASPDIYATRASAFTLTPPAQALAVEANRPAHAHTAATMAHSHLLRVNLKRSPPARVGPWRQPDRAGTRAQL